MERLELAAADHRPSVVALYDPARWYSSGASPWPRLVSFTAGKLGSDAMDGFYVTSHRLGCTGSLHGASAALESISGQASDRAAHIGPGAFVCPSHVAAPRPSAIAFAGRQDACMLHDDFLGQGASGAGGIRYVAAGCIGAASSCFGPGLAGSTGAAPFGAPVFAVPTRDGIRLVDARAPSEMVVAGSIGSRALASVDGTSLLLVGAAQQSGIRVFDLRRVGSGPRGPVLSTVRLLSSASARLLAPSAAAARAAAVGPGPGPGGRAIPSRAAAPPLVDAIAVDPLGSACAVALGGLTAVLRLTDVLSWSRCRGPVDSLSCGRDEVWLSASPREAGEAAARGKVPALLVDGWDDARSSPGEDGGEGPGAPPSLAFSGDGRRLVCVRHETGTSVYDARTGSLLGRPHGGIQTGPLHDAGREAFPSAFFFAGDSVKRDCSAVFLPECVGGGLAVGSDRSLAVYTSRQRRAGKGGGSRPLRSGGTAVVASLRRRTLGVGAACFPGGSRRAPYDRSGAGGTPPLSTAERVEAVVAWRSSAAAPVAADPGLVQEGADVSVAAMRRLWNEAVHSVTHDMLARGEPEQAWQEQPEIEGAAEGACIGSRGASGAQQAFSCLTCLRRAAGRAAMARAAEQLRWLPRIVARRLQALCAGAHPSHLGLDPDGDAWAGPVEEHGPVPSGVVPFLLCSPCADTCHRALGHEVLPIGLRRGMECECGSRRVKLMLACSTSARAELRGLPTTSGICRCGQHEPEADDGTEPTPAAPEPISVALSVLAPDPSVRRLIGPATEPRRLAAAASYGPLPLAGPRYGGLDHSLFGRWCFCDSTGELMTLQCAVCQDWFHEACLNGMGVGIAPAEGPFRPLDEYIREDGPQPDVCSVDSGIDVVCASCVRRYLPGLVEPPRPAAGDGAAAAKRPRADDEGDAAAMTSSLPKRSREADADDQGSAGEASPSGLTADGGKDSAPTGAPEDGAAPGARPAAPRRLDGVSELVSESVRASYRVTAEDQMACVVLFSAGVGIDPALDAAGRVGDAVRAAMRVRPSGCFGAQVTSAAAPMHGSAAAAPYAPAPVLLAALDLVRSLGPTVLGGAPDRWPGQAGRRLCPGMAVLRVDGAPDVVAAALCEQGWRVWGEEDHEEQYHLWFRTGGFTMGEVVSARMHQRINRIPGASGLCLKDRLLTTMARLRRTHGAAAFGFHPEGFCLPAEAGRFRARCADASRSIAGEPGGEALRDGLWVSKPSDLSRGRKIAVIRGPEELRIDQGSVVQRYVARPLCLSGYKFDLRLFVVVTSVRPLRVFLHHDGLARFATRPYATTGAAAGHSGRAAAPGSGAEAMLAATAIPERWRRASPTPGPASGLRLHGPPAGPAEEWCAPLGDVHAHLTNSSLNKESASYADDKDGIGPGCKWRLLALRRRLSSARAGRAAPRGSAREASPPSATTGFDAGDEGLCPTPRIAEPCPLPPRSRGQEGRADAAAAPADDDDAGGGRAGSGGLDPLSGAWDAVRSLVAMTFLALPELCARAEPRRERSVRAASSASAADRGCAPCFELFGLDVMLDETGRPWLLEVNASPSLGVDCAADSELKPGVLRDTVQLVSAEAQRLVQTVEGVAGPLVCEGPAARTEAGRVRVARPVAKPPGAPGDGGVCATDCGPFDPLAAPTSARTRYPASFEMVFPFDGASEACSARLSDALDRKARSASAALAGALCADGDAMELAAAGEASRRSAARAAALAAARPSSGAGQSLGSPVVPGLALPAPPMHLDAGPAVPPPRSVPRARADSGGGASPKKPRPRLRAAASASSVLLGGRLTTGFDRSDSSSADAARRAMRQLVLAVLGRYGSWQDGRVKHDEHL